MSTHASVAISRELIEDAPEMVTEEVSRLLGPGNWHLLDKVPMDLRWDGVEDYSSPLWDDDLGWQDDEPVYSGRQWKYTQERWTFVNGT
jgi:hypothetical protein